MVGSTAADQGRLAVIDVTDESNPGWFLWTKMAISIGSAGVDALDRLGQLKMAEDGPCARRFLQRSLHLAQCRVGKKKSMHCAVAAFSDQALGYAGLLGQHRDILDQSQYSEADH